MNAGKKVYNAEVLSKGSAEGRIGEDIILAERITPLDTPRILRSKGVIVERGGSLSHVAIYCRELGIPCVRLENATKILRKGFVVRILESGEIEIRTDS